MSGEDFKIRRGWFVFPESLSECYKVYCRQTQDAWKISNQARPDV